MATVDKSLAREIIAGNGYFMDDERVVQVVTYTNAWGDQAWAILYARDVALNLYAESNYVRNPQVVWSADTPSARPSLNVGGGCM